MCVASRCANLNSAVTLQHLLARQLCGLQTVDPAFFCAADFCISGGRVHCRRNSYNERWGGSDQTACTPCPSTSLSGAASSALDDCKCPVQFYHAPLLNGSRLETNASSSFECRPSPAGTDGRSNGTQLETLPLINGYWRISRDSSDVRRCPDAERGNASACLGGSGESCAAGLQGIFCTGAPLLLLAASQELPNPFSGFLFLLPSSQTPLMAPLTLLWSCAHRVYG